MGDAREDDAFEGICPISRREFFGLSVPVAAGCVLLPLLGLPVARAERRGRFLVGVNYPWAAYGHDYGKNAWGHDGLITGGWTYQTWPDSQGFIDTRRCTKKAYTGVASLCISADLDGGDDHRKNGEVYVDLRNHPPPGVAAPIDLTARTARCWLYLPDGSAGAWPNAPNGVQLFFKSEGWFSWYR